jgi:hypothetical protein
MLPVSGESFFSTSAQIIPVMFLTLAFEVRGEGFMPDEATVAILGKEQLRKTEFLRACYTTLVTIILVIGESAALLGLGHQSPVRFRIGDIGWVVASALVVGGFGIVSPLVIIQIHQLLRTMPVARLRTSEHNVFGGALVVLAVATAISLIVGVLVILD